MGLVQPHSRIAAAIWAICWGLCVRGLASLGISRSMGQRATCMLILIGGPAFPSLCSRFVLRGHPRLAGSPRDRLDLPCRLRFCILVILSTESGFELLFSVARRSSPLGGQAY